jgi:hypothetical protein
MDMTEIIVIVVAFFGTGTAFAAALGRAAKTGDRVPRRR